MIMSELQKQILDGTVPTPLMETQLAKEGWYLERGII